MERFPTLLFAAVVAMVEDEGREAAKGSKDK